MGPRPKLVFVVGVLLASALALLAWTQTWVEVDVLQAAATRHLSVTGDTAAPALTALALAGLALAGALTIAGTVIRLVLGALEVLLGVSVFLGAVAAIADPAGASAPAVTAATGVAGAQAARADVASAVLTAWPWLAVLAACLMVAVGVGILLTARRWPGPTKRYQARFAPEGAEDGPGRGDAVVDWDDLSRGDDPTA